MENNAVPIFNAAPKWRETRLIIINRKLAINFCFAFLKMNSLKVKKKSRINMDALVNRVVSLIITDIIYLLNYIALFKV